MKVFIPRHLLSLPLVEQMAKMINEYSENYYIKSVGPFDNYNSSLLSNPVRKFIQLNVKDVNLSNTNDYNTVINYIEEMFYTVKGTVKVFEFMKSLLGIAFEGEITYNSKVLEFKLGDIETINEEEYFKSLDEFLSSLLYFQDLKIHTTKIKLELQGSIDCHTGGGVDCYNEFIID